MGKKPLVEPCGDCGHPHIFGLCWEIDNCAQDNDGIDGTCPTKDGEPVVAAGGFTNWSNDFHKGFLWGYCMCAIGIVIALFWCNCLYHCTKRWRHAYRPLTQVELAYGLPEE